MAKRDQIDEKVRGVLRANSIKLWEEPYTKDGSGDIPEHLVYTIAGETNVDVLLVAESLERLRSHAVAKLTRQDSFRQSGLATFNLDVVMDGGTEPSRRIEIQHNIDDNLSDLESHVNKELGLEKSPATFRFICAGKLVENTGTLRTQGLKAQNDVLCIKMSDSESANISEREWQSEVDKTRQAANLLAARQSSSRAGADHVMEITDQRGNRVELPEHERQGLAVGLAQHEKGRNLLKKQNHAQALLYFLDADAQFRLCRDDVLKMVDNYALLCMDIVWCYLCLGNVNNLPDAEKRLILCEECFVRSYGPNLERVAKIKASTGFSELQVDDSQLSSLIAMGYSAQESRLALRATGGQMEQAVNHIIAQRESRESKKAEEAMEHAAKKLSKKLGRTENGDWIDPKLFKQLMSMNFMKDAVKTALAGSNNDLNKALEMLCQNAGANLSSFTGGSSAGSAIDEEALARLISLGFSDEAAKNVLKHCGNDFNAAFESLTKNASEASSSSQPGTSRDTESHMPSNSSEAGASEAGANKMEVETESDDEWTAEERDAYRTLRGDLEEDGGSIEDRTGEEYLDITFDDELRFIAQYRAWIDEAAAV